MPDDATQPPAHPHRGLEELFRYPLMTAIAKRRTRRVRRGTSIQAGELSHTSTNRPLPLSPLEEAILVVSTGLTGMIMHDGPLVRPDGSKELGTPMIEVLGRAASSPDNTQSGKFFMINDEGVWLIRRLKRDEALKLLVDLPPRRQDWSEADWLQAAETVKVHVYKERLDFPRRFPYYHVWNKQMSNLPGTTILMPIVDCTRGFVNVALNLLSEPDGERPIFLDDWQPFRPKDLLEVGAWIAAGLGFLGRQIPYQPIGGIEWARDGHLNPEINIPLGLAHSWRLDYESHFQLQNLMLIGQAIGLGCWIHATVFPPYIYERDPDKGKFGLGFRMQEPKSWQHWPPVPAPLPNPIGIDGVLEALTPPYVADMDEVVDRVLEEKYGNQGTYRDKERFARSYKDYALVDKYFKFAGPYPKKSVEYIREVCRYIFDTYGRFPAHVDAFYLPGVWLQFSHLELEYYEKYFDARLFERQSQHAEIWGED